jgi:hypothetical protein
MISDSMYKKAVAAGYFSAFDSAAAAAAGRNVK